MVGIDTTFYRNEDSVDHAIRIRHERDKNREHRAEMQSLIDSMNALREKHNKACRDMRMIAAERDEAYDIIRENQENIPLSRDDMNARINVRRARYTAEFDASLPKS